MVTVQRIAIIGAGSSGLAQLKQLLDAFSRPQGTCRLKITVFESRSEIGGVWLSQNEPKAYRQAVASSSKSAQMYFYPPAGDDPTPMYDGLRTNLPADIMGYRDVPFESLSDFPDRATILGYLQSYASRFNLIPHIRFKTRVERLYLNPDPGRRWIIESSSNGQATVEEFNNVCVANGHYSDTWIPVIPGLDSFPGRVLHSRFYLRPQEYAGQSVLVVGSFASGSDLARQLASLNLNKYDPDGRLLTPTSEGEGSGFTRVYVSSSAVSSIVSNDHPWNRYITHVPLIDHIEDGTIYLKNHEPLDGVDSIIFATGYNFSLPFCKRSDKPWYEKAVLDTEIGRTERDGGDARDVGGIKGLAMKDLDELMLFLEDDRSISFPVLQCGVVPFPLAETQARLTALLWANLLLSFPDHPILPPNPSNPYSMIPPTPPASPKPQQAIRKSVMMRQQLVFGSPYHFDYEDYLMSLCLEADQREGLETPERWRRVEQWRRDRRADIGLRARTLGY